MRVRVVYWLAVVLALGDAAMLRWIDPQPLARLRLIAFDTLQQLQPRAADRVSLVRIIDIDERSLAVIGAWPWRRDVLARLVDQLFAHGASVVAFDFVLPHAEPDVASMLPPAIRASPEAQSLLQVLSAQPSGDERLAQAITGRPVVLGVIGRPGDTEIEMKSRAGFALLGNDPARHAPFVPAVTINTGRLQDAAAGLGALNWFPEHDQVIRKVPMLVRLGPQLSPSLVAETIRLSAGVATIAVHSTAS